MKGAPPKLLGNFREDGKYFLINCGGLPPKTELNEFQHSWRTKFLCKHNPVANDKKTIK